jgi:putative flippase GtrA
MRFTLYILVGIIAWLIDLTVYQLLWGITGIAIAQGAARVAGAAGSFILNRHYTFSHGLTLRGVAPQLAKYLILLVANWAATVFLIYVFHKGVGVNPLVAKIGADMIVIPSNYWVMKVWIFPKPEFVRRPDSVQK